MLAANKDFLVADVHQRALGLRRLELDQLVQRFNSIVAIASICAGFAFSGLVEFEVPDAYDSDTGEQIFLQKDSTIQVMETIFFGACVLALVIGMYVTVISTLLVAYGYRLALQGDDRHSLDRAVAVLRRTFTTVIVAGAVALLSLLVASIALVYIKTNHVVSASAIINSVIIGIGIIVTFAHGAVLLGQLNIRVEVHGDVAVPTKGADGAMTSVDLEDLVQPDASPNSMRQDTSGAPRPTDLQVGVVRNASASAGGGCVVC